MKKKLPSHKFINQITIETASLELLLRDFVANIRKQRDWVSLFGIEITLLLSLFFTEFKDVWFIPESYIKNCVVLLTFIITVWLFKSVIEALQLRKKTSLDNFMDEILTKSLTPYEYRMLFILKKGANGNTKMLVFRDRIYNCYMLPHLKIEGTYIERNAKLKLAEYLGIPADSFLVEEYGKEYDKVSYKYSEYHHKQTLYYFTFSYVQIIDPPEKIYTDEFQVDGRDFCWMSCQSLDEDENTRKRNSDVVRHITDYSTDMLGLRESSLVIRRKV